jgi:hypothetical protein
MLAYAIWLTTDIDQHPVRFFPSRVAKGGAVRFAALFMAAVLLFFS